MSINLVPCDQIFSKIEDQLSSYSSSGVLDTGRFFAEVALCTQKFGIGAYDMVDAIINLEEHKGALPCNFYLLDSAWLCDLSQRSETTQILQSNFTWYTQTTKETICQTDVCNTNDAILNNVSNGLIIQSTPCNNNNEHVLEKVTVKEYLIPEGRSITWRNPILMTLRNSKSINSPICTKECKNLFAKSPYEISISQQGFNKFLHSTLKDPTIYLKYYAHPEDPNTGLPLIPEDPIIQRAIEYHLMHYFFYMIWLDGLDVNIEKKVQSLRQDRDLYMTEAINYTKMPSFNQTIHMMRNARNKWAAYQAIDGRHF